MSSSSHVTILYIVPKLYNKCKKLEGNRVTIFYKNGVKITGFLRKVINQKQILVNCEFDGMYRLPMSFIKKIERH